MFLYTSVHLWPLYVYCIYIPHRTIFKNLSTFEPFSNISAHSNHLPTSRHIRAWSNHFQKSQHVWTIFKTHSNHFLISQHIRTCVIYIYAPKHLMPSIFHALSLYMHTHSAHIHARNLITFMQRYLYCAPFGARIGVWCWKTPCDQHVAVTKHMHRFYRARSIYSCVRIPSRARCVRRKANLRCITARITWLFHV